MFRRLPGANAPDRQQPPRPRQPDSDDDQATDVDGIIVHLVMLANTVALQGDVANARAADP
eukprot:8989971-Pyramimonas_sp.AAC.1